MTSPSAPSSPPALAGFSLTPTDLLNTEMVPDAAQTFYAFIEGQYDPHLFVPDPIGYFLKDHPSSFITSKKRRVHWVSKKSLPCTIPFVLADWIDKKLLPTACVKLALPLPIYYLLISYFYIAFEIIHQSLLAWQ
ncbi:hypothetical protein O181_113157 [Austropuccinia psidii MF-1]|uniref:Uncharacterized protein n=1 Tax=Austropuccinia psidii MF-1 TaxID=1389203 RepID=A0A9Q3PV26_9BASI|nr:hypothetical protein [Austropuccinia psidii MF-1]